MKKRNCRGTPRPRSRGVNRKNGGAVRRAVKSLRGWVRSRPVEE